MGVLFCFNLVLIYNYYRITKAKLKPKKNLERKESKKTKREVQKPKREEKK